MNYKSYVIDYVDDRKRGYGIFQDGLLLHLVCSYPHYGKTIIISNVPVICTRKGAKTFIDADFPRKDSEQVIFAENAEAAENMYLNQLTEGATK